MFPSWTECIMRPANSDSPMGPLLSCEYREDLQRETSRRYPNHLVRSPQLAPFALKEKQFYSGLPHKVQVPHVIFISESSNPPEETHLDCLYP